MHYRLEVDIDLPRERVIEMFLDIRNLPKWQPDLVSFEPVGERKMRQVGAQTRQVHRMGGREVEITETIRVHNYPDLFSATYEAHGVWNLIENRFIEIRGHKTQWILDSTFKCSGITRFVAMLAPGMFKRQTFTYMKRFKEFAETSGV